MTILKLSEDIFVNISKILKVNYEVLQVFQDEDDSIPNTIYGIKVYYTEEGTNSPKDELCYIPDISTDKEFVVDLAVSLATNHVLPIHVKDVVEDTLYCKYN